MDSQIAENLSSRFRFSYFSSRYWLEFVCKHEVRNGEDLALIESLADPGAWLLQYTPTNAQNLADAEILWATQEEIGWIETQQVPIISQEQVMAEYFFRTDDLISLDGPLNQKKRQAVRQFEAHSHQLLHEYDKGKTIQFLQEWDRHQQLKTMPYERGLRFCHYLLDYIGTDPNLKANYVLVDGKLVGFSIGEQLSSDHWIGLHQKTDYSVKGLGRWMIREQAKRFAGVALKASGGSMGDQGVARFKESFHPVRVEPYFHLKLGH